MRRIFRIVFLVTLGLVVGLVGYEAIMFVRVLMLRNGIDVVDRHSHQRSKSQGTATQTSADLGTTRQNLS